MKIFKLVPTFDRFTGEAREPVLSEVGWLCDFCGDVHLYDSDEYETETSYEICEQGGSEPMFHEYRIPGHENISPYYFCQGRHSKFEYCQNFDTDKMCERSMIQAAVEGKFKRDDMLCLIMYEARANMLSKALETRSLEELGLASGGDYE